MYRSHFPILEKNENLIYLDSASTAQKPKRVVEALTEMMEHGYANIHRGSYDLSERAEQVYEDSKEYIRKYIGAHSRHEIIYTYNATYAFNLLVRSLVKSGYLKKGDTVLLSLLEHHANIVPWQILSEEYGIQIEWIGVTDDGRVDLEDLKLKVKNVNLLSVTAASNVTGAITDLAYISDILKESSDRPLFVVDASQALPHFPLNVEELGIDFAIATGHKAMTDTGVGILYGKKSHLQKMLPAFCG
jgi:cysteine desulfurase / selenocysteine lyase